MCLSLKRTQSQGIFTPQPFCTLRVSWPTVSVVNYTNHKSLQRIRCKKVSASKQTPKHWWGLLKGKAKKSLLDMQPIPCPLTLLLCSNNNSYKSHPEPSTDVELALKNTVCQKRTRSFTLSLQRGKLKAWIWLTFSCFVRIKTRKKTHRPKCKVQNYKIPRRWQEKILRWSKLNDTH